MEVKILKVIDPNQVIAESKGFVFSAKWQGSSVEVGDTVQVEVEINEKFILNKNMYLDKEEIPSTALQDNKAIFPVKVLEGFDDKVIAVKFAHAEEAFLIEIDNLESLNVGVSLFLIADAIELWPI